MKNHGDLYSFVQGQEKHGDSVQSPATSSAQKLTGSERALLAQLELAKQRESQAREELQQVRAAGARVKSSFEARLEDAGNRSSIQLVIHGAEQDHLQRIIADLESRSMKAKATFEQQQEECSASNTKLLLQVAELEVTKGNLQIEFSRLKNEVASHCRTIANKETFGRDKARRLDTALGVLAQERSTIKSLQESSSMRIGRLITSSLKSPSTAFALLWRLPSLVYQETKKNTGETVR
jgi:hypothetical protein